MKTFHPINNNVLLRPDPFAERSRGGLWLNEPKRQQGLPRSATVIAVGPGRLVTKDPDESLKAGRSAATIAALEKGRRFKPFYQIGDRVPPNVWPGDKVMYLHFKGQDGYAQPEKYGDKLIIVDADDLLCVLEEEWDSSSDS